MAKGRRSFLTEINILENIRMENLMAMVDTFGQTEMYIKGNLYKAPDKAKAN